MYCNLLKAAKNLKKHSEWLLNEIEQLPHDAHKNFMDVEEYLTQQEMIFFTFRYIQLDFSKIYKILEGKDKSKNNRLFASYDTNPNNFVTLTVMAKDV